MRTRKLMLRWDGVVLMVVGFVLVFLGAALEAAEPHRTQVVVIATHHFITDMPEGYTPGHLRALLMKVVPDVLAVEAPTNVADPWADAPMDLWRVTRPWARASKIDTVPVGWDEPNYQARLGRMLQAFQSTGKLEAYQELEARFQLESARGSHSCQEMNTDAADALWRNYHADLHRLYGKREWNAKIVANIFELCRQREGKRVVIVFGAAHCYYILDALSNVEGIDIVSTQAFFPLSQKEVDAQTVPKDYLWALRPLNFQNYGALSAQALGSLEGILETVRAFPEFQGDYHLFRGKLLLHRLKPEEARLEFEKVSSLGPDVISAADDTTRLREAGLVFAAMAKNQAGKHAEARADWEAILQMDGISPITKNWVRQLLQNLVDDRQR